MGESRLYGYIVDIKLDLLGLDSFPYVTFARKLWSQLEQRFRESNGLITI